MVPKLSEQEITVSFKIKSEKGEKQLSELANYLRNLKNFLRNFDKELDKFIQLAQKVDELFGIEIKQNDKPKPRERI